MSHPATQRRPRVLVVDDEVALTEIITEALEQAGMEVAAATGIKEAEERVADFRPDVVIVDVFFPEGPCWPFVASLRWLQPVPAVVLMSAFGAAFGPQERELGDVVLAKPFRLGVLLGAVRRLLADRGWPEAQESS